MADPIIITKGSDLTMNVEWKNPDGTNMNLNGHTFEAYDFKSIPEEQVELAVVNVSQGETTIRILGGNNLLPVGEKSFRVRVYPTGGDKTGSHEIVLDVQ